MLFLAIKKKKKEKELANGRNSLHFNLNEYFCYNFNLFELDILMWSLL